MKTLTDPIPVPMPGSHISEVLDSKARMAERVARREQKAKEELALTQARLDRRRKKTVEDEVFAAAERLKGANSPLTIRLIESKSSRERDFYLLAEEYLGPNRREVLRQFSAPRKASREAFLGSETATPKETAETPQPVSEEKNASNQSGGSFEDQLVDKNGKPLTGAIRARKLAKLIASQTEE